MAVKKKHFATQKPTDVLDARQAMSVGGINKYTLDKPPDLRKSSLKNFREEGVLRVTGRDSVVLDRVGKSCFFNWGHSGRGRRT